MSKRNPVPVQFRIDAELLEEFRELAKEQRRSGSGEAEIALQRHVELLRKRQDANEPVAAAG